jgi:predicted phage tail protein
MMMVEDIKKNFNNSLKEIQENTAKQIEDLKEEAQKSLKELQENTTKQVVELNKTIQDLKREIDTVKKTQSEATLEIETLGKKSGNIDVSISNRIQEMEERISGVEDSIENISRTIKENAKCKKTLTQNIQEIQDTIRRQNLRIIGVDENEWRNSSRHIIIRTTNALNKDRILKGEREKGQVTYKGKPIRITPDFSPETMKARRAWSDIIQTLREHKCKTRLLYPAKVSINLEGETKVFHDKTKFTHYLSTNAVLQRIITEKNQYKDGNHILEKARR